MATAHNFQDRPKKPRGRLPRIHLIYFVLALFDLVAVMGGLYLSNRLSSLIGQSVENNRIWDARIAEVYRVRSLVGPISKPVNEAFDFLAIPAAKTKFANAYAIADSRLKILSEQFSKSLGPEQKRDLLKHLASVRNSLASAKNSAEQLFISHAAGDLAGASKHLSRFNHAAWDMDRKLELAVQSIRSIRESIGGNYAAKAIGLKRFEYLIGLGIIFMAVCVVLYGHAIGRIMHKRYRELELAHDELDAALAESRSQAEQLAAINTEVSSLNRQLSDSMIALHDAQDEAVRRGKMAQLGQLTATVAHELRNPLGAVRTAAFLVDRKSKSAGLDLGQQIIRINNGIDRCDDIVSQLLDFSRVRSVTRQERPLDAWVQGLLEEEVAKLPPAVSIEFAPGTGDAIASFDPDRMRRAIINLVINASEAMVGRGDDASKHAVRDPRIAVATLHTGRGFEIEVGDNGPGIPAEFLEKVKNPLFTTKSFGTGLGLPAVEQVAHLHGGGLDVASEEGKGATFTIWFPQFQKKESSAAA